ncbi:MAG: hypothetical protein WCA21_07220 [Terracidiphilus sp.]
MTKQRGKHPLSRRGFLALGGAAAASALLPVPKASALPPAGIASPVLTRGNDNDRSYFYNDTVLTVANVTAQGLRRYFPLYMEGDARGAEAQALILPSVQCDDGNLRDVILTASMNNTVWAYDYNTSDILWVKKLGIPVNGGSTIDMHVINDHWGILSTGVIDPDTKTWYGVAWESPDGTAANGAHFLHSLNIANGSRVHPPVPLANITYQPPNGGALQRWGAVMRKQRCSLALTQVNGVKTIFFAAGSVQEVTTGSAGWIVAYDVVSNKIAAALAMSAGYGAGVWMAGSGLSIDDNGDLLFETGNGSFDPNHGDYGECVCRVRYTPPHTFSSASLKVVDWWSPYTDAGREGEDPTLSSPQEMLSSKLSGVSAPTSGGHMPTNMASMRDANGKIVAGHLFSTMPTQQGAAYGDEDLGSAGPAMIRKYRILLAYGKDGIAYPIKMDAMGKTMPADFANSAANYAKLAQPPFWYSYFPGFNVNAAPQNPSDLDFLYDNKTRHLHSTSPQFFSQVHGQMLACWGENGQCRVWSMQPNGQMTFLADSDEVASINCTQPPGGMPGGFMCISANGNKPGTALLWAIIPYGDGNATVTNGRLLVYDLENYVKRADGTSKLNVLWDSQAQNYTFLFPKFNVGVVSGGKFVLPRYDGGMDVLSLA